MGGGSICNDGAGTLHVEPPHVAEKEDGRESASEAVVSFFFIFNM